MISEVLLMDRKALIDRLVEEIREGRKRFEAGKSIPLEEFDWSLPHIVEPRVERKLQHERMCF